MEFIGETGKRVHIHKDEDIYYINTDNLHVGNGLKNLPSLMGILDSRDDVILTKIISISSEGEYNLRKEGNAMGMIALTNESIEIHFTEEGHCANDVHTSTIAEFRHIAMNSYYVVVEHCTGEIVDMKRGLPTMGAVFRYLCQFDQEFMIYESVFKSLETL